MTMASYFFRNDSPDFGMLKRYFWYFSFHNDDLLSNTTHFRDHIRRFHDTRKSGQFNFDPFMLNRDRLRGATYSSRGRLSRALLALYANQDPRDWQHTDRSVLANVYYQLTDHPNLHQFLPANAADAVRLQHPESLLLGHERAETTVLIAPTAVC